MNYLFLSTNDFGGAGQVNLNLMESLCAKGHYARMVTLNKYSKSEASIGLYDNNTIKGRLVILFLRIIARIYKLLVIGRPKDIYSFNNANLNRISAKKILSLFGKNPDIIAVGWVSDFVNLRTINELKTITKARVIFAMTDNAPITGGCHYPWDCKGYQNCCYPCPALGRKNKKAQRTLAHKIKYTTSDMMIEGSTNDTNRARLSSVFKNCIIIPSVTIAPNPFHFDKKDGRQKWNINDSRYVIMCGAASIEVERKGFKELMKVFNYLRCSHYDISNITILLAGGDCSVLPEGYDVRIVGKLSFEDLFKAYACSDLFVCPSLEDSGPMMINYGVMSYIPVVAFNMGIAQDVIIHKKNGYIAEWRNVEDFANGIIYCKNNIFSSAELKDFNDSLAAKLNNERSFLKYLGIN